MYSKVSFYVMFVSVSWMGISLQFSTFYLKIFTVVRPPGGNSHMKQTRMLVILHRSANFVCLVSLRMPFF